MPWILTFGQNSFVIGNLFLISYLCKWVSELLTLMLSLSHRGKLSVRHYSYWDTHSLLRITHWNFLTDKGFFIVESCLCFQVVNPSFREMPDFLAANRRWQKETIIVVITHLARGWQSLFQDRSWGEITNGLTIEVSRDETVSQTESLFFSFVRGFWKIQNMCHQYS